MPGLEPWLRGEPQLLDPLRSQLLLSLQQAEEDIAFFTDGLTEAGLWAEPAGLASVGFHWRHIIGSVDRLLTYAEGQSLTEAQLATEQLAGTRDELLRELRNKFRDARVRIERIPADSYGQQRFVGRKMLPTTVGNLLVHIAEHTQRHVGQLIVTAKLVRTNF